jgi:Protein of unknown function (DUF3606)
MLKQVLLDVVHTETLCKCYALACGNADCWRKWVWRQPGTVGEEIPMADDLYETRRQDEERRNAHQDYELGYWAEKFGVWSRRQLRKAVHAAGAMARRVERHLRD